jgi:hypothetical protein
MRTLQKKIEAKQCLLCLGALEDVSHFLLDCRALAAQRDALLQEISEISPEARQACQGPKEGTLHFLLSSSGQKAERQAIQRAVLTFVQASWETRCTTLGWKKGGLWGQAPKTWDHRLGKNGAGNRSKPSQGTASGAQAPHTFDPPYSQRGVRHVSVSTVWARKPRGARRGG